MNYKETNGRRILHRILASMTGKEGRLERDIGWTYNYFWNMAGLPYLYRRKGRCSDARFWDAFKQVLVGCGVRCDVIFHDNKAGWRRTGKMKVGRFLRFPDTESTLIWLERHSYWGSKWSMIGKPNDNYNLMDAAKNVFLTLSHEGDCVAFSTDIELLEKMKGIFIRHGLVALVCAEGKACPAMKRSGDRFPPLRN